MDGARVPRVRRERSGGKCLATAPERRLSSTMARESSTALTLCAMAALVAVTTANVDAASTTSVPLRLHGTEAPIVMVRVQGKVLPLQLDLGDASSLVLHPDVLAALRTEPTTDSFKG